MRNGQGATVKQLGELLELTPRRVQQLATEGVFPKIDRGRYPLVECVRAYIQYWQERAEGRFTENELDQTRLQREQLEVRKRAVQVAKAEGSVVTLEDHEEVIVKLLSSVRSVLLALPGSWGSRIIGIKDPVEGLEVMKRCADEIVEAVAYMSIDFEIEEPEELEEIPADFPGARALNAAGITTMEKLRGLDDFTMVKGIGEKTAERLEEVLAA